VGSQTPAGAFAPLARYLRVSTIKVPRQAGTFQHVRHYLVV